MTKYQKQVKQLVDQYFKLGGMQTIEKLLDDIIQAAKENLLSEIWSIRRRHGIRDRRDPR